MAAGVKKDQRNAIFENLKRNGSKKGQTHGIQKEVRHSKEPR